MKQVHSLLTSLALCAITTPSSTMHAISLDSISQLFGSEKHTETFDKEYEVAPGTKLHIRNLEGNITIERTWKENKVCVRAIKKTSKPEFIDQLQIKQKDTTKGDHSYFTMNTVCEDPKIKGSIEYSFIVPINSTLDISTQKGSIKINEAHGAVRAVTQQGNIEVVNANSSVVAQTEQSGSITIYQAHGNVKAITNRGNIAIHEACKNVIASTQKGAISTSCCQLPHTSRIQLESEQGQITLALPSSVDADLFGKTDAGTVTSQLPITLKPQTTTLNNKTWVRFKKEVDGTIGSGEAEIKIMSKNGNIRLVETS